MASRKEHGAVKSQEVASDLQDPNNIIQPTQTTDPRIIPIKISPEELRTGLTTPANIQAGLEQFHKNGAVMIEDAIPFHVIDKLRKKMMEDLKISLARTDLKFNHGVEKTNFNQMPPLTEEYLFEELWANRHAIAILENILGPRPRLCYAGSNMLLPGGGGRQAVHVDLYGDIHQFPHCVEVYLYLHDVSIENGSTEIWPGTHTYGTEHLSTNGRSWIKKTSLNKRAQVSPPLQAFIPKGTICMRDLRLWHAGMNNFTKEPRIRIAFLYWPEWWNHQMGLTLPMEVKPIVESWDRINLVDSTDFIPGPVDHLRVPVNMNFTQDSKLSMKEYRDAIDKRNGITPGTDIPVTPNDYWTPPKYKLRSGKGTA